MTSFKLNRQSVLDVALRHGQPDVTHYLDQAFGWHAASAPLQGFSHRAGAVYDTIYGFFHTDTKPLHASVFTSTQVRLTNASGDYLVIKGTNFGPLTSTATLDKSLTSFGRAVDAFDTNENATLKSISFGTKSGAMATLTVSSTQIKLAAGSDVITLKGHFPTGLGEVYDALDQTMDFDHHGVWLGRPGLLALSANSPLFDYDVDSITVTANGKTVGSASFSQTHIGIKVGAFSISADGHFPGSVGELYAGLADAMPARLGHWNGDFPTVDIVRALGASGLHKYDLDDLTIKNGSTNVGTAHFSKTGFTITAGDFELKGTGKFPHTAGDVAELLTGRHHDGSVDFTLTRLVLTDTHDGSVLASISGKISTADAFHVADAIVDAVRGHDLAFGTSGADTITGSTASEYLFGLGGGDTIKAGAGNDHIWGGSGADILSGGKGHDTFHFTATSDSKSSAPDTIVGFSSVDRFDFSDIDANTTKSGLQDFVLDTGGSFKAGEVHQSVSHGDLTLTFNTDADSAPEMTIVLGNHGKFTHIGDFIA